jgi:hypothetical protein
MLTGYIVDLMSYCELRGYIEYNSRRTTRITSITPRKIISLYLGKCGTRYCLDRKQYSGEIFGLNYTTSPHFILREVKNQKPVVIGRVKVNSNNKIFENYFSRLYLDAYAVREHEKAETLILAVVIAKENSVIVDAVNFLLNEWNLKPVKNIKFAISTRYFDIEEASRILGRVVSVIQGRTNPKIKPGSYCKYCPHKNECPVWRRLDP